MKFIKELEFLLPSIVMITIVMYAEAELGNTLSWMMHLCLACFCYGVGAKAGIEEARREK